MCIFFEACQESGLLLASWLAGCQTGTMGHKSVAYSKSCRLSPLKASVDPPVRKLSKFKDSLGLRARYMFEQLHLIGSDSRASPEQRPWAASCKLLSPRQPDGPVDMLRRTSKELHLAKSPPKAIQIVIQSLSSRLSKLKLKLGPANRFP